MWCTYCRKSDHDDAQCWCTRVVGWHPDPGLVFPSAPPMRAPGRVSLLTLTLQRLYPRDPLPDFR